MISSDSCRICLKLCSSRSLEYIQQSHLKLLEGRITLKEDDLPQKICKNCYKFLNQLQNFYNICERTENLLRNIRQETIVKKEDVSEEELIDFKSDQLIDTEKVLPIEKLELTDTIISKNLSTDEEVENELRVIKKINPDYDFEALDSYLFENCISIGSLETRVLSFRTQKNQSHLPANNDLNCYEFELRYPCDYCNKKIIDGKDISGIDILGYHIKKYHSEIELNSCHCKDCDTTFESKALEQFHYETSSLCGGGLKYSKKESYSCSFCSYVKPCTKNGYEAIKKHCLNHHEKMPHFECPSCNFVTFNMDHLRVHCCMRNHSKELVLCRQLQCDFCSFSCCLEQNMEIHVNHCHWSQLNELPICTCDSILMCTDLSLQHILLRCPKAGEHLRIPFKQLLVLEEVPKPKYKLQRVTCSWCGLDIARRVLNSHMRRHEDQAIGCYICDLCGRKYQRKLNLKLHMRKIHIKNLSFSCKYCDRKFRDWSAMSYHVKTVHDNSLLSHTCDVCGKRYEGLYRLQEHKTVHTNEKNHECQLCSLKFRRKRQLLLHQVVHSTERSVKCLTCSKTFKTKKAMRQHSRTHEDRAFTCPVCEMSFTVGHTLRNHIISRHPDFPMPPPGTPLRNVDLRKYLPPICNVNEFK